jgi:hypothetical protein
VSNVRAAAEEPFWSLNVKRGILSILQVDAVGIRRVKDDTAAHITNRMDKTVSKVFFRAMEESIFGECQAIYHIRRIPSVFTPRGQKVMNISKTYDHSKCVNAPAYFNSLIKGLRIPEAENFRRVRCLLLKRLINVFNKVPRRIYV